MALMMFVPGAVISMAEPLFAISIEKKHRRMHKSAYWVDETGAIWGWILSQII